MVAIRVPPGRAGRLWLRGRLAAAERAAGLLERKARVLHDELRGRVEVAERSALDWATAVRDADEWTLRAAILAGERGLLQSAEPLPARVDVAWTTLMGVRYPDYVDCCWPDDPGRRVPSSAAHSSASRAYHRALEAAVHRATTEAAVRVLTTELATTNRRVRALRRRWIPALREELAHVDLRLEELDRDEAVGIRHLATHNDD